MKEKRLFVALFIVVIFMSYLLTNLLDSPGLVIITFTFFIGLMGYITYLSNTLLKIKLEIESLRNPHTGLQTKYELYKKAQTLDLADYYLTYFSINNFQEIINVCGISYSPMIEMMVKDKISSIVPDADIYEIKEATHLLMTRYPIDIKQIISEFDKPLKGHNHIETFNLNAKIITFDHEVSITKPIQEILQIFDYAHQVLEKSKQHVLLIKDDFIHQMEEETYFKAHIESALKNEDIVSFFQPKYDSVTKKIIGAEALSRWLNQETLVSPSKYIYIAEASGLIYDLDLISFDNACRLIKRLAKEDLLEETFKVSTNLSTITLKNLKAKTLETMIDKHQVNPKHLSVEITESIAVDYNAIKPLLDGIFKLGITIEIDDFTAGNSSLTVLSLMHASIVKVDQAVLPKLIDNSSNETMIYQGIVSLLK
ncbi:MAG: EAL domain-containing protein [Candidatus Izemoplasmataceae bacterium]